MILDYQLTLSSVQAITVSTNSTNTVDAVMAGWGANEEVYARFVINVAYGGTAGSSVTLAIQIAQDTAFGTVNTVVSYLCLASVLTARAIPLCVKLPVAMMTGFLGIGGTTTPPNTLPYRYVRAYYTLGVATTTFTVSCHLVKDVGVTVDKAI